MSIQLFLKNLFNTFLGGAIFARTPLYIAIYSPHSFFFSIVRVSCSLPKCALDAMFPLLGLVTFCLLSINNGNAFSTISNNGMNPTKVLSFPLHKKHLLVDILEIGTNLDQPDQVEQSDGLVSLRLPKPKSIEEIAQEELRAAESERDGVGKRSYKKCKWFVERKYVPNNYFQYIISIYRAEY